MQNPGAKNDRKTPYVSVNLTIPARDALRDAVPRVTTDAGRRVNQSEVLLAALRVALRHHPEFIADLRQEQP